MAKKKQKLKESVGPTVPMVQLSGQEYSALQNNASYFQERLAELEMALDLRGWERNSGTQDWEFNRGTLGTIIRLSRLMGIKNPLVKRAVGVQALYTFALGYEHEYYHELTKEVLDDFLADPINKSEWNHTAISQKDRQLTTDGNIFFAVFADTARTGMVRFRTVDVEEIVDIINNPDDKYEPWYYKRTYTTVGPTGLPTGENTILYPDYRYLPANKPATLDVAGQKIPIQWGLSIYHVRGPVRLSTMKFSLPELYSVLDWATAYKNFLEDWATIMKAYSKMAMQVSNLKGKKGVAAAKSQLGTTNANDSAAGQGTAQMLLAAGGVELKAIKTAGATTSAEEGRPIKLMIAAGADLPETFFGDADVGNFATSETLDRPTELKMLDRQKMWKEIMETIFSIVVETSARANMGKLAMAGATAVLEDDPIDDGRQRWVITYPNNTNKAFGATGKPINTKLSIKFPNILERNMDERIRALVGAFTMNGRQLNNIIDDRRLIAEVVLEALQIENRREIVDRLYPPGEEVEPIPEPVFNTGGFGDEGGDEGEPKKKTVGPTDKKAKGKGSKK